MPKSKKSKMFSLVSAYESEGESPKSHGDQENDSNSEEDMSESENTNTSSDSSSNISKNTKKEAGEENFSDDYSKKRSREGSFDQKYERDENRDESDYPKEIDHKDNLNDINQAIKIETQVTIDSTSISIKMSPKSDNEISSSPLNKQYTLENGFPPGCEKIRLPPEPKAMCSQSLQNKIIQVTERMKNYNYSINEDIHRKKSFKNPSIYEKLIEAHGINEFGSSFPNHIDDLKANGYMFYDELDQIQRADWAKKEKEKKERTKIEMVSATKKK